MFWYGLMKEIQKRTKALGSSPDGSALMSKETRSRYISTTKWGIRQYLCICKIYAGGVI